MKRELPDSHGLSEVVRDALVFYDDGVPSLTDVQYASLQAGVGCGESVLVVSPTSTGKTRIALWAIAASLERGHSTVYLVTHRALAKQKYEDFRELLLERLLSSDSSSLVIATGDEVRDSNGNVPADPLQAPLLVATYEKYLALLAGSGVPSDMTATVLVCDEIQLIGDKHRGRSVDLLLTLFRNAGWQQFVGLSAVIESDDARALAGWLNIKAVIESTREKHLRYECWEPEARKIVTSAEPGVVQSLRSLPKGVEFSVVSILDWLLSEEGAPLPVIVFCMTKKQTYDMAKKIADRNATEKMSRVGIFDHLPETSARDFLAKSVAKRVAVHNTDLTEEERRMIEGLLQRGEIDVICATSTLAAGVNFPLGAAVFASWERWDNQRKARIPIDVSEFQNMSGRVGRMGSAHEYGRVLFLAPEGKAHKAGRYLNLDTMQQLEPRVTSECFQQLVLQLVASGLCNSVDRARELILNTFSAHKISISGMPENEWVSSLMREIDALSRHGLLLRTSSDMIAATPLGKAVSLSGLLPQSGVFLLDYFASKAARLVELMIDDENIDSMERLTFLVFCACYSTPEFRGAAVTRYLPWPLRDDVLFDAEQYKEDLPEPVWQVDSLPVNAAWVTRQWVDGVRIAELEGARPQLSAGMLLGMFRDLGWVMHGLISILSAVRDAGQSDRPYFGAHPEAACLPFLAHLLPVIRRLSRRVASGLPDSVLWMTELDRVDSEFSLYRQEIMALYAEGYSTPEKVMLGSSDADVVRQKVFRKAVPTPNKKANWLRDTCRNWKQVIRKRAVSRHRKRCRSPLSEELIVAFYESRKDEFEVVFENVLSVLGISCIKLDKQGVQGAPDYLVEFSQCRPIIIELKSKTNDKLVNYNDAVEVLAASEVHGHRENFCVTLCHPGVDPSVPTMIVTAGRLSVVESHDLGEALIRLCEGSLTQEQVGRWLASPGQALASDLPFRAYSMTGYS